MTLREAPFGHTLTLVAGAKDAQAALSAALWSEAGTVPPRVKELAFLRTSLVNDCKT